MESLKLRFRLVAFLWHFEFRTYGKSHMHLVDIFRFRTTIIAFGAHETSHQIVGQRIPLSPLFYLHLSQVLMLKLFPLIRRLDEMGL